MGPGCFPRLGPAIFVYRPSSVTFAMRSPDDVPVRAHDPRADPSAIAGVGVMIMPIPGRVLAVIPARTNARDHRSTLHADATRIRPHEDLRTGRRSNGYRGQRRYSTNN